MMENGRLWLWQENQTLLALALDELNDTNKNISTQIIVIEHWWDGMVGIAKWKA